MTNRYVFRRAFTLIEMLVVIAILAILMAILTPSLAAARRKAQTAKCASILRTMSTGQDMWTQDHNETLLATGDPSCGGRSWMTNLWTYAPGPYVCPSYRESTWGGTTIGYWGHYKATNIGAAFCTYPVAESLCYRMADFSKTDRVPLFLDWDGSSTAMYVDSSWVDRMGSSAAKILRHGGGANVVFLDGHVGLKLDQEYATISRTNGF